MGRRFGLDERLALVEPAFRVPLHLSPDGSALLVTTCRRDRRDRTDPASGYGPGGVPGEMLGSRVLVVDTSTGAVDLPFGEAMTSWGGRWSPDGEKLAAYVRDDGPACLGIWWRRGGERRLHREVRIRSFFGFEVPRWTPGSASVVVKVRSEEPADDGSPEGKPLLRRFSFDPARPAEGSGMPGWAGGYRADLAVVDATSGHARTLISGQRVRGWEVSPDGNRAAALCYRRAEEELQQFRHDLVVLSLDGSGEELVVAREITQEYGVGFSWSPDGSLLAYISTGQGERAKIFVVPADGSSPPRNLTPEDGQAMPLDDQAPKWSPEGERVLWPLRGGNWELGLDGSSVHRYEGEPGQELVTWVQRPCEPVASDRTRLLYLARPTGSPDLGLVQLGENDVTTESVAEVPGRLMNWSWGMEVSSDGTIYLLLEASDHPAELWWLAGYKAERLTSFNPDLDQVELGRSRLVSYRSLAGKPLSGSVLLPPGHGEATPLPLIVEVYGGMLGSLAHHAFNGTGGSLDRQLLAAHGYAVLSPDMPMDEKDPLRQLPGLVLPAINQLVELRIADPERIGVMGHSYGGYCTMALVVQTDVFAAALASAGFYNLVSVALTMNRGNGTAQWLGWAESGQGRMGGSLWEKRDSYIENSPVFYLDRVTTPILLTLGTSDFTPPAEAEAVYVALRRLEKEVELVEYEGEEHWPGMWTEPAYRDYSNRVIAWFDEHLKKLPTPLGRNG